MTTQPTQRNAEPPQQISPQISLPGQTHAAEGPHDQTGMYLAHHAFRRDLEKFVAATRRTPVEAAATWRALDERWKLFASILHHHHTVEDDHIWPVLTARVEAAGDRQAMDLLAAMEAEHEQIDPALEAIGTGFAAMITCPCAEHRDVLAGHVAGAREALLAHLRHEETEALPLLQRVMTEGEFAASEKAALDGYSFREILTLVPWAMLGVPREAQDELLPGFGRMYILILRLTRGRFARFERKAFCYV